MQYFTIKELTRSDRAVELGIDNHPSLPVVGNLEYLVETLLDPVRAMWGKPLYVTSGYRCDELNKAVGGSATSAHRFGLAADIVTGLGIAENNRLFEMLKSNREGLLFDQIINEYGGRWVHMGTARNDKRKQFLTFDGKHYRLLA